MKLRELWKVSKQIAKCATMNHICSNLECWCPCHDKSGGKKIKELTV